MPVLVLLVPVTVCSPATEALQLAPLQLPSGETVKAVVAVTSPSELLKASRPSAVYAWLPPATMLAVAGASTRWSSAAGETVRLAVPVIELVTVSVAVMLCAPAVLRVTLKVCTPASAAVKV